MPKKKKKKTKARVGRPPGRPAATGSSSGAKRLYAEMVAYHRHLAAQAQAIEDELSAIGNAMAAMSGTSPAAKAKPGRSMAAPARPKGRGSKIARRGPRPEGSSLREFIVKVLKRAPKPMSVKDIASNVVKAGYQTSSNNLPNQVSMALAHMVKSKDAKKVARGQYAV